MRVSVLSVFVATWMHSIFGIKIDVYPSSPLVNDTVILKVTEIIDQFLLLSWYKGQNTNSDQQIIWLNSNKERRNGSQIFKEADIFTNGSFQIKNAQKDHSGFYTVSVQTTSGLSHETTSLTINDPNEGLTVGQIVGIVIGSIAGAVLVLGGGVFLYKKHSDSDRDPVI
ncbi:carcinoembryonic antigen-related cell adhesion molecule 3-like isoform X3 [Ranitomeya imitator]|uniref:carcinoembryonic antigen-related cell adhesion molecule 3-like isoform X3 n=1 Tax=Ranitomeya imitator TaxID=111125 RepID=UPI0037E9C2A0